MKHLTWVLYIFFLVSCFYKPTECGAVRCDKGQLALCEDEIEVRLDCSNDNDQSTVNDRCIEIDGSAKCSGDPTPGQDDTDACTVDACDPANGITHTPRNEIDDDNPCTLDKCNSQTGVI